MAMGYEKSMNRSNGAAEAKYNSPRDKVATNSAMVGKSRGSNLKENQEASTTLEAKRRRLALLKAKA